MANLTRIDRGNLSEQVCSVIRGARMDEAR